MPVYADYMFLPNANLGNGGGFVTLPNAVMQRFNNFTCGPDYKVLRAFATPVQGYPNRVTLSSTNWLTGEPESISERFIGHVMTLTTSGGDARVGQRLIVDVVDGALVLDQNMPSSSWVKIGGAVDIGQAFSSGDPGYFVFSSFGQADIATGWVSTGGGSAAATSVNLQSMPFSRLIGYASIPGDGGKATVSLTSHTGSSGLLPDSAVCVTGYMAIANIRFVFSGAYCAYGVTAGTGTLFQNCVFETNGTAQSGAFVVAADGGAVVGCSAIGTSSSQGTGFVNASNAKGTVAGCMASRFSVGFSLSGITPCHCIADRCATGFSGDIPVYSTAYKCGSAFSPSYYGSPYRCLIIGDNTPMFVGGSGSFYSMAECAARDVTDAVVSYHDIIDLTGVADSSLFVNAPSDFTSKGYALVSHVPSRLAGNTTSYPDIGAPQSLNTTPTIMTEDEY